MLIVKLAKSVFNNVACRHPMKYCLHTIHWVLVLSRFDFRFDKIIKLVSNIILKFEEDKFIFKVNWHMLLEGCHFVKEKRSLFQSTTV